MSLRLTAAESISLGCQSGDSRREGDKMPFGMGETNERH